MRGVVRVATCSWCNRGGSHCTLRYALKRETEMAASSIALCWDLSGAPNHTCVESVSVYVMK